MADMMTGPAGPPQIDPQMIAQMSPDELQMLLQELAQDPEANADLIAQIKNAIAGKKFGLGGPSA